MIVRLRGGFRNAKTAPRPFTLALDIPTAIECGLPGLVPGNSAISARVIKDAGIKVEVN